MTDVLEVLDRLSATAIVAADRAVTLRLGDLEHALEAGVVAAHVAVAHHPRRLAGRLLAEDASARETFGEDRAWIACYLRRLGERHVRVWREVLPFATATDAFRAFADCVVATAGRDRLQLARDLIARDVGLDLRAALEQLEADRNRLPRRADVARRTDRSTEPRGGADRC